MKHKEIFQKLVDNVIYNEEQSYYEYLSEEFPEIDEEDYFDINTYGREDMNHVYAYALQCRDYLLENPVSELST